MENIVSLFWSTGLLAAPLKYVASSSGYSCGIGRQGKAKILARQYKSVTAAKAATLSSDP